MHRKLLVAVSTLAVLFTAVAVHAAPVRDAIWVNYPATLTARSLQYGDAFTAGYTSRTPQPWALAECWANGTTVLGPPNQGSYAAGDVIWSEYRSLYPGGPVGGAFSLSDPIQGLWLGGGADCRLSLVKFGAGYAKQTVLATAPFDVAP